jgi:hypothetical protein
VLCPSVAMRPAEWCWFGGDIAPALARVRNH